MAKRLISLMLAMLMLLVVLVSCGKDGDAISETIDDASRFTTTLNLWIIAEDGMDADQAAAVNAEINKLTKKKFRTQVNIKYINEAEYYDKLEKAFVDYEVALAEAKKKGEKLTSAATSQETVLNEYGIPELKYPVAHEAQVDVLFIGSAEKYRTYVDNKWITSVEGLLENNAAELAYYIPQSLLTTAKYNGLYGVPNNNTIGSYTYLAVDEDLANKYLKDPAGNFENNIYSAQCYEFLSYVYEDYKSLAADSNEKIYPIYSETGKVDFTRMHYWSYDVDSQANACIPTPDTFSIFGGFYFENSFQGSNLGVYNLLADESYQAMLAKKAVYENTGKNTNEPADDFVTTDPDARTAVRIVEGNWADKAELERAGYTVLTVDVPRATDENVFGSMFAIGSHTTDEQRSMEIIAYLNTNKEMRNLLQYGIQDVNYTLKTVMDDEGNVYKDEAGNVYEYAEPTPDNKYKMDINKTGNVFLAYPDSAENALVWENGKMQNLDAITYPTLGMYFKLNDYKLNTDCVRILNKVSAKVESNVLNSFSTEQEVKNFFSAMPKATETEAVATYLLAAIGETVQFTAADGTTKEITVALLKDAMDVMNTATINPVKDALQSPNALYQVWFKEFNGL